MEEKRFNWMGEFREAGAELAFSMQDLRTRMRYLRYLVLYAAVVFLCLLVHDLYALPPGALRTGIMLSRLLVPVAAFGLFCLAGCFTAPGQLAVGITAFALLAALDTFVPMLIMASQGFYALCLMVAAFIMLFFLLPNRWAGALGGSVLLAAAFLVAAPLCLGWPGTTAMVVGGLCLGITIAVSAFCCRQLNVARRKDYMHEMELEHVTVTDLLTGASNRAKFTTDLEAAFLLARRAGPFCLILMDLDNFKGVNDVHGHLAGDRVLAECAQIIRSHIRGYESFARWGGESFIFLVPQSNLAGGKALAQRICDVVNNYDFAGVGRVGCSLGVAVYTNQDSPNTIIGRVDACLYLAKARGRGRVVAEDDMTTGPEALTG